MKTVHLPYGTAGLDVRVPDSAVVVDPVDPPALHDEAGAVRWALANPDSGKSLEQLIGDSGPSAKIVVVFPDLTRPMPNRTVLPPILGELERLGAGPDRVELLCATGTHRRATPDEMSALIGSDLLSRYRVHDHSCTEDEHLEVGRVDGTAIRIDRKYVDADIRILTGFVEPHFFAGFSGGPKGVCPGLADLDTVLEAHSRKRIRDPRATWTVLGGNPVHDFVSAAASLVPPDLSLDVTIDSERRLTGVFCGPLPRAHRAACASVLATSVTTLDDAFDVVVTTNGGYPLDRNLYQAVKGMAAAERVVVDGGTIVMAAQCVDGLPGGGAFEELLGRAEDAADLLSGGSEHGKGPADPDGWQTQVLGRVLQKADVLLRSDGLSDDDIRLAKLSPVRDLSDAVAAAVARAGSVTRAGAIARAGAGSRLCVLVRGPLAVATVTGQHPDGP